MSNTVENSPSISYGVYIHIPFCKVKCGYCAFVSYTEHDLQREYISALVREMRNSILRGSIVDTVYLGGGTPSCLYKGAITEIFGALRDAFDVKSCAEITVEANPESVSPQFVSEIALCGVNRVSMGLQSANDGILKKIGRIHTRADFMDAAKLLRAGGISNLSSDLILGLPEQTIDDIESAVNIASEHCSHISVYALSVEEGTPLYRSGYIPDDDTVADFYDFAYEKLKIRGFSRYEVSNFARNGAYSRHNCKYWNALPYIGFGVAAHGYDGQYIRYSHTNEIRKYLTSNALEITHLTEKDRYNEYIMLALRTEKGIDLNAFYRRFGYRFDEKNAAAIASARYENAIDVSDTHISIKPDKMFVMNGIIELFMK